MSYSFVMRQIARRISVCLLVVAFVFSGAAWAACIELPVVVATSVSVGHHSTVVADSGSDLNSGEGQQDAVAPGQVPVPGHDHASGVKCCSMAPVVNLTPNLKATSVQFPCAVMSFRVIQRNLTGFIVALEPGIPKPIV